MDNCELVCIYNSMLVNIGPTNSFCCFFTLYLYVRVKHAIGFVRLIVHSSTHQHQNHQIWRSMYQ